MFYVIKHVEEEGPGLFESYLPENTITLLAPKKEFPEPDHNDTVLIMGGPMGVYEKEQYSFINKELDFIKRCFDKNVKILGICLGAQMIAEALGGKVFKGPVKEVGWYKITHTEHAKKDKIFSVFPEKLEVFQWHQDTFELPKNAIRLAKNENYINQAFKIQDNVYGLQYHIEVTNEVLNEWFQEEKEKYIYCDSVKLSVIKSFAVEFFKKFISL